MELYRQMEKLEAIQASCGGGPKEKNEPKVDFSKMSPSQVASYKMLSSMKMIRENRTRLEALGNSCPAQQKVALHNRTQREVEALKKMLAASKKDYVADRKTDEFEEFQSQVKKTEELWRRGRQVGDETAPVTAGYGTLNTGPRVATRGSSGIVELGDVAGGGGYSIREDDEFQLFFENVSKRDEQINRALDCIEARLLAIHQNAKDISQELDQQAVLLEETEKKVDNVNVKLKTLNKKLKETIKKVDEDKMCVYVFCVILLLGLVGGIYFTMQNKDKKN